MKVGRGTVAVAAVGSLLLGLRLVVAKSYARIHWQNLANFGVLPLEFTDEADYDRVEAGDDLAVERLTSALRDGDGITVRNMTSGATFLTRHRLSARQVNMVLAGGQIPLLRQESLNT